MGYFFVKMVHGDKTDTVFVSDNHVGKSPSPEEVVRELLEAHHRLNGYEVKLHIVYRDTMGVWNELVNDSHRYTSTKAYTGELPEGYEHDKLMGKRH